MIKYDRFWVTMKERGITQYDLYEHYEITRSLLDRLRKNKNIEIFIQNSTNSTVNFNNDAKSIKKLLIFLCPKEEKNQAKK